MTKRNADQDWRNYGGNSDYASAMADMRKSGAAGPHDVRPNRSRTRHDSLRKALKDQDW